MGLQIMVSANFYLGWILHNDAICSTSAYSLQVEMGEQSTWKVKANKQQQIMDGLYIYEPIYLCSSSKLRLVQITVECYVWTELETFTIDSTNLAWNPGCGEFLLQNQLQGCWVQSSLERLHLPIFATWFSRQRVNTGNWRKLDPSFHRWIWDSSQCYSFPPVSVYISLQFLEIRS